MTSRWNTTPANAHNIQPDCAFINRLYRADTENKIGNLRSGPLPLAFELDGVMAHRQPGLINFLDPGRSIRANIFLISVNFLILLDSWRVIQNALQNGLPRDASPFSRASQETDDPSIPTISAIASTERPRRHNAPTSAMRRSRGVMCDSQPDKSQVAMTCRFRARSAPPPPLKLIFAATGRSPTRRSNGAVRQAIAKVEA